MYLLQLAEDDAEMTLVEVAKEEEAIGIAAGAYFAGAKNALLMQNHGFLASINGIVSLRSMRSDPTGSTWSWLCRRTRFSSAARRRSGSERTRPPSPGVHLP